MKPAPCPSVTSAQRKSNVFWLNVVSEPDDVDAWLWRDPFADGNGRVTRLLADLIFVAAQDVDVPELYAWNLDKLRYIELLRQCDKDRDPRDLAAFIGAKPMGE